MPRVVLAAATVVSLSAAVGVAVAAQPEPAPPSKAGGAPTAKAVKAVTGPQPGTYRGPAFDACAAPSGTQMTAWLKSSYRGVVIYFGGVSRGCKQPNLTASWVKTQQAAGWRMIPMYVGPQASCTYSQAENRISTTTPAADARVAADDAVVQAKKLGLPRDSVLTYNLERYRPEDQACAASVLTFLSEWTSRLHSHGYLSGFYSPMTSGVPEVVAAYHRPGFVRPDYVDFARWDGRATVTDDAIPSGHWSPRRRMKQYSGPHKETWGGVTINVDSDYLDVAPLPVTRSGDVTGDGWSDVVTVAPRTGAVLVHSGNGTTVTRSPSNTGRTTFDAVTRFGDFTGDGRDDLIARDKATGDLWLYPGSQPGFGGRTRIAAGLKGMRDITAVGDVDGDGHADVMAVEAASGTLMFLRGDGRKLSSPVAAATGWNATDGLAGVGDADGDGVNDLVSWDRATGEVRVHTVRAGRPGPAVVAGTVGVGVQALFGVGDFDRDGSVEVMTVDATGTLHRRSVSPAGLSAPIEVGRGVGGLLIA